MMSKKVAVICQRYGLEVNGGAEYYAREIAERLADRYEVEVLTTCAVDYVTWNNTYEAGVCNVNGIRVIRFPSEEPRSPHFGDIDTQLRSDPHPSMELQEKWLRAQGPYCPKLPAYLKEHLDEYDAVICVTYLYYPASKCIEVAGKKAIFIPTAHTEPYLYMSYYRDAFTKCGGFVFLTHEEADLVHKVFHNDSIPYEICGVGVDVPEKVDPEAFRKKYGVDDYIVYVGRIDGGKGCDVLFRYFAEYKKRNPQRAVKLVLMGKPVLPIPKDENIKPLGFVSEEDKFNGIRGAKALILPSQYESLSIAVLEAMRESVPVIVNGACDVLRGHCIRSNGGLYYRNYFEFEGCLNYLYDHPEEYSVMCGNARAYVDRDYQWSAIAKKFDRIIDTVSGGGASGKKSEEKQE